MLAVYRMCYGRSAPEYQLPPEATWHLASVQRMPLMSPDVAEQERCLARGLGRHGNQHELGLVNVADATISTL